MKTLFSSQLIGAIFGMIVFLFVVPTLFESLNMSEFTSSQWTEQTESFFAIFPTFIIGVVIGGIVLLFLTGDPVNERMTYEHSTYGYEDEDYEYEKTTYKCKYCQSTFPRTELKSHCVFCGAPTEETT